MDHFNSAFCRLNIPTSGITAEVIQEVLLSVKAMNKTETAEECCDILLKKIWLHLKARLIEFDDQLLMSICFYSLLSNSHSQEYYLHEIYRVIENDNKLKENNIEQGQTLYLSISLSYGIFQSSYLLKNVLAYKNSVCKVLDTLFMLLSKMAYEYSQYTFIVFKIMSSFKKVIGTEFLNTIFQRKYQILLLNITNHNWENPITGVRSLNRIIFQTLLLVLDSDIYNNIIHEINDFYWNKAKYLMLAEIVEHYKVNIEAILLGNDWIEGLIYSLFKPGLVSAGTDMYNVILKKISSDTIWVSLFLSKVMKVLIGSSYKAIENFCNYWCLNTLIKFPCLKNIFLNEFENIEYSQYKLYSMICILKQANKLGFTERNWNESKHDNAIIDNLEHCQTSIRMLAFEIICTSQGKHVPTEVEYEQILLFLYNNVNTDCTVLRISIINNLTSFLNKLHLLNVNIKHENISDTRNLKYFCKKLQQFVITSFAFNGNYQRKIATIRITQVILKCSNVSLKSTQENNKPLVAYLKENECWLLDSNEFILNIISLIKDPAKDVQMGVLQILTEYYSKELSTDTMMDHLIQEGLICISSKFFYEISCGHNIFQLIINVISVHNVDGQFKTLEDIFEFAYNEVSIEYNKKRNVVQSIEDGKQLHSFMNLLSILFVTSVKKSHNLNITKENILVLLDILEQVSKQFVLDDESQTSSDFSKMNIMVESLIEDSGIINHSEDKTKISGLHQIVLNCLWLNVKSSCELASVLIKSYKNDEDVCRKCLSIICYVLETSRHKGAIEAAGSSLGDGINFLTSCESDVSQLPFLLLQEKLNDLLFETSKMSSVTRRGAGLSIMVHRIVSNDTKKGKPLFHFFMKTLLNTCSNIKDSSPNKKRDIDNEKDIPKAIYIHFLTRVVTDSSLASECMYYSGQLAALAFDNLTNSHWQIRNAALQLYGALIPKLIGQKKASGTDDETIATVACDEFRTHSPNLWKYIITQLQNPNQEDSIQAHSNLVPVLNVLSSIARRYNFSYDETEQENPVASLLPSLFDLLASPIYSVRRLTSHSITNMFSFNDIFEAIMNYDNCLENSIHGILLLISKCNKVSNETNQMKLLQLIEKYKNILEREKHSYICKWVLEKLLPEDCEATVSTSTIKTILSDENNNRCHPGISLWAKLKILKYLKSVDLEFMPEILTILSEFEDFEKYIETCTDRIKNSEDIHTVQLFAIVNVMLSDKISKSSATWELLYNISLKFNLSGIVFNTNIEDLLNKPSYKIPFMARLFKSNGNSVYITKLSECIHLLSNPECNDVDMRNIAALSNNELAYNFDEYSDTIKIKMLISAIILLQDEDVDVRNTSTFFYSIIVKDKLTSPKHPYICLTKISSHQFLNQVLRNPFESIKKLYNDLLDFMNSISVSKSDNYNPFANVSKNVYLEANVLKHLLELLNN